MIDQEDEESGRSRRWFVRGLVGGFGLLTGAAIGVPVVGFLMPPNKPLTQPSLLRAASVGQVPENSARLVRFQGRPVLLIHEKDDRYHALSAVCTHMDVCNVDWDPARRILVCPCHKGAFDVYGNVLHGPPPRPLATFAVDIQGDGIFIRRET